MATACRADLLPVSMPRASLAQDCPYWYPPQGLEALDYPLLVLYINR